MSQRTFLLPAVVGLSVALSGGAVFAQAADGSNEMYRCPGNDYKNTITAQEAQKQTKNGVSSRRPRPSLWNFPALYSE